MTIKKQIGASFMTAVLGVAFIAGGTYAYFNDTAEGNSTFAAGTIELSLDNTEIINIDNIKPGDSMTRDFELHNDGTLDMDKVFLDTSYKVNDAKGDNTENFADHIEVEFLYNVDKFDEVIFEATLSELEDMTPEAINENIIDPILGKGLEAGDSDDFVVKFNFVDNEGDQNQFQGDSLELEWTFTAIQTAGEDL